MEKVFIIDGPDGTGKTTLANKLSEIYDIPIYHLTYYNDREKFQNQFNMATNKIQQWIRGESKGFILDRYILSEYAYQRAYRPDIPLLEHADLMFELLEHRAATGEIDVIISLPYDKDKWFDFFMNLTKNRDEMYNDEKMLVVYEEYLKIWKKLRYNKHVYRYDFFQNMEGKNKGKILTFNE